ncbi:MAG: hypothetical protein AAF351_07840 [Pseudomonadota bacterium]
MKTFDINNVPSMDEAREPTSDQPTELISAELRVVSENRGYDPYNHAGPDDRPDLNGESSVADSDS